MPTPTARADAPIKAVRLVFALAVLALPAQVAIRHVASEPYPGLYQPSFGGVPLAGREAVTTEAEVTLEFAGGATRAVGVEEVLPPTRVLPRFVFTRGFGTQERADDPRTVAWLRERVAALDERTATAVDVRWQRVGYSLDDGSRRVVEETSHVRVDLGAAR
ncbi:hypothetical protein MO973_36965 [Paenibacillus sp. TRM 82003]|uniref:hypothetical protein n=1 Tax=Kineococcus sp. TRM81007 TaxID=2925831 RepID=UPI001F58EB1B|nr:hypothetical protein [Kineococcus sp. TRM81007]MCI2239892.1 hypothetical protein [Kineococcus sp. TRM81007]MCI3925804.1 hypothetical protein [Paenibacillus sp. TRM 82003]